MKENYIKDFIECVVYVFTAIFCVGFAFGLGAWLAWKVVGLA